MMRSLWTAASGMTSQQVNVDTISNNMANVNTSGYKRETATFKSLLYANMAQPNVPGTAPAPLQVGHGVRVGSIVRDFSQGTLMETGNSTDMAIEGNGFFTVQKNDDEQAYTKDGSFRIAPTEDGNALVTSSGMPVLNIDDETIILDSTISVEDLVIRSNGVISYLDKEANEDIEIAQLKVVQFPNKAGLEANGDNIYTATAASGEPILETDMEDEFSKSSIRTGYLEGSNVNIANEMVNLIVAQRAYELNSTAIKTADSMLQQANELKR